MKQVFAEYPFPSWIFACADELQTRASRWICTGWVRAFLRFHRCKVGRHFAADGIPLIRMQRPGALFIGDAVTINTRPRSNMAGIMQRSIFQCIDTGRITLEDGCGLSGVVLSARKEIRIGKRASLGVNTRIYDHDFHSLDPNHRIERKIDSSNVRHAAIEIGDDVLVGANAIILKGTRIGDRSVVGAGSVVTSGDYPEKTIIAGNPARAIRSIET
jgi:acetyltransferase-like isoleucine patch superfamily enzyme